MITWLASYPKSGNTWLRIFLTNYLHDGSAPADINDLDGGPIASARAWFDEWAGIEASLLTDDLIDQLRPEVYRCMLRESPQPLYIKAHDAWQRTGRGEGMFPADVTAGVLYILRSPLDVAASFANHLGVEVQQAVDHLCAPGFALSRSHNGLSTQLRQFMGSWSGHVRSWVDESRLPVQVLRYEDMQRDPQAAFAQVVRFCGLPYSEERLSKAIRFSAFDGLKQQEREKGFHEKPMTISQSFFRHGRAGGWRSELTPAQANQIITAHAETMHRFGYLNSDFTPIEGG